MRNAHVAGYSRANRTESDVWVGARGDGIQHRLVDRWPENSIKGWVGE